MAIAVAMGAGVTACGSGSEDGLGSATIVLGGKVITWAAAYVAVCEDYFVDHGLDVELTVSPQGTTSAIAGLVSGDAVSAMTGAPAAVSPVREGAPVQMLFNGSQGYSVQVIASNELFERKGISPDDPLEKRVEAMRGETASVLNPGDSIDQLLRYVLPRYDIDPDQDLQITSLNNYSNMFAAMKQGNIDLMAGSPPNGQQAEQQGIGRILFSGGEIEDLADYPYLVGSANTRDISSDPERVKAVVSGMADAMELLRTDPDAGKPCLRKEFADLDQATFDAAYTSAMESIPETPLLTEDNFATLSKFAEASGTPLGVDYGKAVAADIVKDALDDKR